MTAGRKINSQSQEWGTPPKYVRAVKEVFGGKIDLDPCSSEYSMVQAEVEYQLPEHDGLKESWNYPTIYVNPPYGIDRERGTSIKHWLARCAEAHEMYESEVIALVPGIIKYTQILGRVSISNNLTVDTNLFHVDADRDRVGIGTAIPDNKLEITDATAAQLKLSGWASGNADELEVSVVVIRHVEITNPIAQLTTWPWST